MYLVNISDKAPFTKPSGSYVHTEPTYLQCFHFEWIINSYRNNERSSLSAYITSAYRGSAKLTCNNG
jgi:hypothetical protein